ncbi:MAG: ECF transporter S component [Clostridium sp.]|uniref:ECF transporter S component n=1 Tax=Clostridium sp. TaxID=1506 RepID=UPI003F3488AF
MKKEDNITYNKVKMITLTGLMIAIVFVSGSIIKIPTINGFMQMGDCMVFLSAVLLGRKYGFLAAGIGMALVDASGGYVAWIPFTFVIKGCMALCAASIILKYKKKNLKTFLIAFVIGGVVDLIGYFIANAIMGGIIVNASNGFIGSVVYAIAHVPGDLIQVIFGIIIATIIAPVVYRLRNNI